MRSLVIVVSLLLLVALTARSIRRRRFARAEGAFRCKARVCGTRSVIWPGLRSRWTLRRLWARWEGDELVVRRGMLLLGTARLPARVRAEGVNVLTCLDVTRLGGQPIAVDLDVSDGSRIEVATRHSARLALVGPYLTAALHGLPRAPAPRRQTPGAGS